MPRRKKPDPGPDALSASIGEGAIGECPTIYLGFPLKRLSKPVRSFLEAVNGDET
jgi:hypothetical protein